MDQDAKKLADQSQKCTFCQATKKLMQGVNKLQAMTVDNPFVQAGLHQAGQFVCKNCARENRPTAVACLASADARQSDEADTAPTAPAANATDETTVRSYKVWHVEHDLERELPAVAATPRGQVDVAADARLAVPGAAAARAREELYRHQRPWGGFPGSCQLARPTGRGRMQRGGASIVVVRSHLGPLLVLATAPGAGLDLEHRLALRTSIVVSCGAVAIGRRLLAIWRQLLAVDCYCCPRRRLLLLLPSTQVPPASCLHRVRGLLACSPLRATAIQHEGHLRPTSSSSKPFINC